MPLLDHFHPPLSVRRHWHSFHNAWATYLAADLNQQLPSGYFAEPNVQFGIEIDVATFEDADLIVPDAARSPANPWQPEAPTQSVIFEPIAETVEVTIVSQEAGPVLAAAIELVSPANKDRASHRDAFVAKCQTYLQQGIGLMVVDVVTSRTANLHQALLHQLQVAEINDDESRGNLSAIAYRVVERSAQVQLDMWHEQMQVGEALPTMPLWLRGGLCLPVDLDRTYQRTCNEQRIDGRSL